MAPKRPHSQEFVPNPFIKKKNLEWSIDITGLPHDAASSSGSDEDRDVSPHQDEEEQPTTSAIEAGQASIEDHLNYFSTLLAKTTLSPFPSGSPHLSVEGYRKLYEANAGSSRGAHFIIHQHDHPVAGTHYDLRLQINETSSASWAIMYGLPGDPNSFRLNRNATETRIHCLWNHLIETASHATGSLLIWDTGTYTILPTERKSERDDSQSSSDEDSSSPQMTEQQKLHEAFAARKIRLQLHGSRLPEPYALYLRLTHEEDIAGRKRSTRVPKTRRRRGTPSTLTGRTTRSSAKGKDARDTSSDSEPEDPATSSRRTNGKQPQTASDEDEDDAELVRAPAEEGGKDISPTERELRELEDEEVRRTNAYTGATNSIRSVHQRQWYLSLDRESSGFVKRRREGGIVWERGDDGVKMDECETVASRLTYPFYVRGVEHERSVVTGRLGSEVLRDEGVTGYIGRKGWQAILK
ncbi:DNA polymerase ligase-domain-containing protein [Xylaria bambusicola]|uniref:DNA polymerase ligase-domain-containing protein n=1 Tax=Xylaria bambusicola TaxID=326684 RepID=UPI002008113E|nr:DNA polymerase ligase-domain-containing protein [Xylaria bambusicola]KAI0509047.1 DNA polymerase ligase-domain-containing protein [Xylaria bambusicola]